MCVRCDIPKSFSVVYREPKNGNRSLCQLCRKTPSVSKHLSRPQMSQRRCGHHDIQRSKRGLMTCPSTHRADSPEHEHNHSGQTRPIYNF